MASDLQKLQQKNWQMIGQLARDLALIKSIAIRHPNLATDSAQEFLSEIEDEMEVQRIKYYAERERILAERKLNK